jgi:hypothetical protein
VRQEIPPHSSVALAPRGNDLIAPYFGPNLTRRITLSRDGGTVDPRATWLLAAPGVRPVVCPGEWRVVTRPAPNWIVARTTKRRPECPEAMRPIR